MTFKHLPRSTPGKPFTLPPFEKAKTLDDVWRLLTEIQDDAHERWLATRSDLSKLADGQLKLMKRMKALERKLK